MCTTYLSQHDLAALTRFVRARLAGPRRADPALRRLAALARAALPLPAGSAAQRHVALGSAVHYRSTEASGTESVLIAPPLDPDALLLRLPVLAPLALGLLGRAEGSLVAIELPFGRTVQLEILEVRPRSGLVRE